MGPLIGFAFGYLVGMKAGPEGLEKLRQAWEELSRSEEFQGLIAAATGLAQNALAEGGSVLAAQVQAFAADNANVLKSLGANGSSAAGLLELSKSPELKALVESGTRLLGALLAQSNAPDPRNPAAPR